MCEAYVIPFLFGSFFTVYHPYIDLHFLKCFFCYFKDVLCGDADVSIVSVDELILQIKDESWGGEFVDLQEKAPVPDHSVLRVIHCVSNYNGCNRLTVHAWYLHKK